jgi:hypothetical protein
MKKAILSVLLLFAVASVAFGLSAKYQIFSEKKGWFGLGGRTIILLDKESGDSWNYTGSKWVAIPKVTEEVTAALPVTDEVSVKESENDKKARVESEVNSLKAKQEADLKTLQAKQAEEIKSLIDKMSDQSNTPVVQEKKAVIIRPIRAARAKANVARPADASKASGDEEGPPAWLTE